MQRKSHHHSSLKSLPSTVLTFTIEPSTIAVCKKLTNVTSNRELIRAALIRKIAARDRTVPSVRIELPGGQHLTAKGNETVMPAALPTNNATRALFVPSKGKMDVLYLLSYN